MNEKTELKKSLHKVVEIFLVRIKRQLLYKLKITKEIKYVSRKTDIFKLSPLWNNYCYNVLIAPENSPEKGGT